MASDFDISEIEENIIKFLPEVKGLQKTVLDAMYSAVIGGGKRIRPLIMLETYRFFAGKGADIKAVAPFMSAIEMIHASSLIHDDLPCMDNDTLRRGKPTTWVSYGEDMAVLAGDALIVEAFSVMSEAVLNSDFPKRAAHALNIIAQKTGIKGMIGGQTVDVENTGKPLDKHRLDFIYNLKTSALLEACMMTGAVIGGVYERDAKLIDDIGECALCIGLAFQIQDDILDETSSEAVLGKPIHSDEKNKKTTYVSLYGLEYAQNEVKRLSQKAKGILKNISKADIKDNMRSGVDKECMDYKVLEKIIDKLTYRKN